MNKDLWQYVTSFDIETTSLTPNGNITSDYNGVTRNISKGRIWSIGAYGRNKDKTIAKEFHYDPDSIIDKKAEWNALKNKEFYSTNKVVRDYFESDDKNFRSNDIYKHIDNDIFGDGGNKRGMILIQNSQFERRWMSSLPYSEMLSIHRNMIESQMYNGERVNQLYRPAEVSKHLQDAKNAKTLAASDKAYDRMIEAYKEIDKRISSLPEDQNKFYVADLMDFTAATLTKAAAQGKIPESYSKMGHNVDFLAKLMLGEEEIHGAMSDAKQQYAIFKKMNMIREELVSGSLSDETKDIFTRMREAEPYLREVMGMKVLKSNIQKYKETGKFDTRRRAGDATITIVDNISGEEKNISVPKYVYTGSKEDSIKRIMEEVDKYGNTSAKRHLDDAWARSSGNIDDFIDIIGNIDSPSINNIENLADNAVESILLGGTVDSDTKKLIEESSKIDHKKEFIRKAENVYDTKIKNIPIIGELLPNNFKKGYGVLGLGAAALGLYASMDSFDDDLKVRAIREDQQRLRQKQYADPTIRQFQSLDYASMPAGVGKANWEERNKHYEY
mgnify:FL=1|jgi:hypothetical protein